MKTISIFILFIFSSSLAFAQDIAEISFIHPSSLDSSKDISANKRNAKLVKKHTKVAVVQLRSFLNDNLDYSEVSRTSCLEGTAILQINLSSSGEVVRSEIIESPHIEISNLILKTLSEFEKIDTKKVSYAGAHKIQIPISFTLR